MSSEHQSETNDLDLTSDSILEELNKDESESKDTDEETPETTEDETKEEDEEVEEKEEEEEKEDEIKDEEEEQLLVPPRKKEIIKKYPNFFKDFPQVEAELFRGRQFTEIFPDIDTAKEASEKADTYDQVEEDLAKGDIRKIIAAVKDSGQEAINNLADDYLGYLQVVDKEAYIHVISGVIKQAVESMAKSGRDNEDEDLFNAAKQLHVFMFGKKEFEPHKRLSESRNTESERLSEEKRNWNNQRFETSRKEALDKVRNRIQSVVDTNIDKKNSMTPYIKKNAVKDAMTILDTAMSQDRSFQRTVDSLLKDARKANLSAESMQKVVSAYLSKAKSLLPGVIQKAKNEALKGIPGKRAERDRSGRLPITGRNDGSRKSSTEIPTGLSSFDALNKMMGD